MPYWPGGALCEALLPCSFTLATSSSDLRSVNASRPHNLPAPSHEHMPDSCAVPNAARAGAEASGADDVETETGAWVPRFVADGLKPSLTKPH